MKAERVQFWERVIERTRAIVCRFCDFLEEVELVVGALKGFLSGFRDE